MRYENHAKIKRLSKTARISVENLEWSLGQAEIDDIFSAERCDLKSDLNSVVLTKMPRFLGKRERIKSLSLATTLEGQAIENRGVQRIVAKVNSEWLKASSMCLKGNSNFRKYVFKPPKRIVKTNKSLNLCNRYFENELKIFFINFFKHEGFNDGIDFLMINPCDLIVKSRLNKFKKQLADHLTLSLQSLKNNRPIKQKNQPLSTSRASINVNSYQVSKSSVPKISDFTTGIIMKAIGKEKVSAYEHLNASYASRLDDNIKEMDIEEELENIIQQELTGINKKNKSLKSNKRKFNKKQDKNEICLNKFRSDVGNSKYELDDLVNIQLESIVDEEINQINNTHLPHSLEMQFEEFTKELNMKNDNQSIDKLINDNEYKRGYDNNGLSRDQEGNCEGGESKSIPLNYFDGNDNGRGMKAVYDKTLINDDDEISSRKHYYNKHKSVRESDRMIRNEGEEKRIGDVEDNEKKRREYEERQLKKQMHYEEYYMEEIKKGNDVNEVKRRRRRRGENEEKKKKKKDEKKHKKKKKNRNKDKKEKSEIEESKPEKVPTFEPDGKLYTDSTLSMCLDVYQFKSLSGNETPTEVMALAPTTQLCLNFDDDFDITQAPSLILDTPLMRMFLEPSGAMDVVSETISHMQEFNIDVIDHKNAFLWSLVLTSLENKKSNTDLDTANTSQSGINSTLQTNSKKSSTKQSSNPLIQAFKQAVEANKNKQKDDKSTHGNVKPIKMSKYLLMRNMGSGLSTLFRLQSNLKAGTRDLVKEISEGFQKDLQKFLKKQQFLKGVETHSSPIKCDFSDSLHHFEAISSFTHKLYVEAEFKLSQREKLLKYNQQYNKYGNYSIAETATTVSTPTLSTSTTTETSTSLSIYTPSTMTYSQSPKHSTQSQPSTLTVAPVINSVQAISAQNNLIAQPSYEYYPSYPTYPWTYMPPYPAYSHPSYFHPFYAPYPQPNHYPMTYGLPSHQPEPSYPITSTPIPIFSESTSSKQCRFYVFMVESPESVSVEKHLENRGMRKFDVHNTSLLNYIGNFECQVYIHQPLLPSLHHIPNLITLKRDSRVIFGTFSSLDDVIERRIQGVFSRGGVVLLELSVLLSCSSDVFDSLCKHISITNTSETPWSIVVTSHTPLILQSLIKRMEEENKSEETERLKDLNKILCTYQSQGLIHFMPSQSQHHIDQQPDQSEMVVVQSCNQRGNHVDHASDQSHVEMDVSPEHPPTEPLHHQSLDSSSTQTPFPQLTQPLLPFVSKPPMQPVDLSSNFKSPFKVTSILQSQTTENPINQSQTTENPISQSQTTETPINQSQTTETPISQSQTTETPINQSQTTENPISQSQTTETPINQSQTTETPINQSQTTETPINQSHTTETPISQSQTTELPINQSPTTEHLIIQSSINETSTTQSPINDAPINQSPINEVHTNDPITSTEESSGKQSEEARVECIRDYYNYILNCQSCNNPSYRHFIFITDLPRSHHDITCFHSSGIELFNIVDFMQTFVSKTVQYQQTPFEDFTCTESTHVYTDATLSNTTQTIAF